MKTSIIFTIIILSISLNASSQYVKTYNNKLGCNNIKNTYATNSSYNNLENNYDMKYFKTDISAGIDSNYIEGNVVIKSLAKVNIDTLVFEFSDTMTVDSIKVNNILQSYNHNNFNIFIYLNSTISSGNYFTTKVYFKGSSDPNHLNRGVETTTDSQFNFKSTWTLSESYHMNDWLPCKQDLTDKIDSSDFFITVDTNLMAGSNGILSNITDLGNGKHRFEWKSRHPIDYYLISFAVSDYMDYSIYAHPQGYSDSILVQNFIYDTSTCLTNYKQYLDNIPQFIENYSNLFGLYPFADEKYGHCLVELGGGMEHQTMTTIGFFDSRVVAHELAHQWFGDNVTCATWQDIWLNEGFASYSEYLSYQCCGTSYDCTSWLTDAHNRALNAPSGSIYVPFADIEDEGRVFDYNLSYRKGASIIHMIRYEINNDTLFFASLKNFQTQYADSTATGEDFKNSISAFTGIDFTNFFNQWYYGEGYPIYNINWKNYNDTLFIQNIQTTSSSATTLFTIPVEYKINFTTGNDTIIRLNQTQNTENYEIYLNKKVSSIEVDPDNWLLKIVNSISNINDVDAQVIDSKLYPNPSVKDITIESSNYLISNIKIVDIYGKVVMNKNCNNYNLNINLTSLKKGLYFVYIKTKTDIETKKLIIE